MEESLIAEYPARDPLVFCQARGSHTVQQLAAEAAASADRYEGIALYLYCGASMLTNNVLSQRPYDVSELAGITSSLDTIKTEFESAGMEVCFSGTAFYQSDLSAAPTAAEQAGDALEYNTQALYPWIAANLPDVWDAPLDIPRVDAYSWTLANRASMADGIHGDLAHELAERDFIISTWFDYLYTGSWNYTREIEKRVADAEVAIANEATLYGLWLEATYAMVQLPATSAKTAYQSRLDAIEPTALFFDAKRLITVAEAAITQESKDAAQAQLDAAETAGYVDQASPNTIAEQQGRLDAIVISSIEYEATRLQLHQSAGW